MATGKKTGGRIKGTPNRTTAETKEMLQAVIGRELDKLGILLEQLEPVERINAIAKLLPYIIPRQTEMKTEIKNIEEMTDKQREARIEFLKNKLLNE